MKASEGERENCIKSWETYKILNKIKENVQLKRRIARDVAAQQSMDTHGNQITIGKRLNDTKEQLTDLLCDSKELITNIKLANERREASRRFQEDHQRARLLADLQQETEEATNKVNVINSRWAELADISDPMDLNERLHYQSERIEYLMKQKDGIIKELQVALNKASNTYNNDQLKHQGDIQCLIERIDEQIDVMKTVYLEHLELLHRSIDSERRTFKFYHSNEWQNLYDERTEDSQQNLANLLDRKEKYFEEISSTRLQHEEINRKMRIQLDKDNDLVQQKLQRTKAEIELNTKQLNYNYYVLQKRATENIIVRNKQKNRLIKVRACIAMLRKKINETKTAQTIDIERQTHHVFSLFTNIKELERKLCAFSESDDKKFQYIWQLHETNADSKLRNIMIIDKMLQEKHLGIQWQPFPCKKSLKESQLQSIQSAIDVTQSQCIDDINSSNAIKRQVDNIRVQQTNFSDLFYTITEQISSQSNWMLGDNFDEMLHLIEDEDQKQIITIDNIFMALGISNMENVHLLKQYFLPYAFCTTCSNTFTEFKSTNSVESGDESVTNVLNKCSDPNHSFRHVYVEQHMIPIILQQFLTDLGIKSSTKTLSTNYSNDNLEKSVNALNSIDINKIEHFWNEYVSVIPFDLELIWDTIVNGLLRYLQILKKRKRLIYECNFLRQQNAEIRHLLQQYSKDESKTF